MKFAQPDDAFLTVLRQRVDDLFNSTGRRRRDCAAMYTKTLVIAIWFVASYAALVFLAGAREGA